MMSGCVSQTRVKASTPSRGHHLEPEGRKAHHIQLARVVVVIDDEHQGAGRRLARATTFHDWNTERIGTLTDEL